MTVLNHYHDGRMFGSNHRSRGVPLRLIRVLFIFGLASVACAGLSRSQGLPVRSTIPQANSGPGFGGVIAFLGDVDNDGVEDFGTTDRFTGPGSLVPGGGRVKVYSGESGVVIHDIPSPGIGETFGAVLAPLRGDINQDGCDDFVVSSPNYGSNEGRVRIYSGADSTVLLVLDGAPQEFFGVSLDGLGDVNGDGIPDLAIGSGSLAVGTGKIRAYSGSNGLLLYTITQGPNNSLGRSAKSVHDQNSDGVRDIAARVGLLGAGLMSSVIDLYSGVDGSLIRTLLTPIPPVFGQTQFGDNFFDVGDIDGDGLPDLGVTEQGNILYLYSSVTGTLVVSTHAS